MAQSYGSAAHSRVDVEARDEIASEDSPLLGVSTTMKKIPEKQGRATLVSSIGNLANTILGSGMLSLPLALASAGVIPGTFTCMFSGATTGFGLYLFSRAAARAPHRRASFFAMAELTYPKAAIFIDAAIAIKCFGISISYLMIVKSLLPRVIAAIHHRVASPNTRLPDWALSSHVWLCFIMSILAPLSFMRHLNSFRYVSYIAILATAYLVVFVVYGYLNPLEGAPKPGKIWLVHFTPAFLSTFPVQVLAFTCAQNFFPIYNELIDNTQARMNIVIGTSIGFSLGIYEIIGLFGYLTFGSKVGANIIAMYPSSSALVAGGQLAIAILVMSSYPIMVPTCRTCLDKIFRSSSPASNIIRPGGNNVPDRRGLGEMSTPKHAVLTVGIVLGTFTIAYFVDNLEIVLSLSGATGSTMVSFILPGLFFWKLTRDDPGTSRLLRTSSLGLAIYGMLVFILCLGYNIYKIVQSSKENNFSP